MSVRMPSVPQRVSSVDSEPKSTKTSKRSDTTGEFGSVLASKGAEKKNEESGDISGIEQTQGFMASERRINERHQFLNESARQLNVHPFSLIPMTKGVDGLNPTGALGLQTLDQAQQLLNQVLASSPSARTALDATMVERGASLGRGAEPNGMPTDANSVREFLNKSDLKSAFSQLKESALMTKMTGAAAVVKNSIATLSQHWANEIQKADQSDLDFNKSFQSLSTTEEHSPAEQLQAVVKAVAQGMESPEGIKAGQSPQDVLTGGMTMNNPSSALSQSAVRQPSLAMQLAMATHMDVDLPQFTAQLKRLSLQIQDPAGVMLVEIVKEAQELHVRAVIPPEAMDDLQNLESDIRQQLSQQGLELGSFEMYSQGEQEKDASSGSLNSGLGVDAEGSSDTNKIPSSILDRRI